MDREADAAVADEPGQRPIDHFGARRELAIDRGDEHAGEAEEGVANARIEVEPDLRGELPADRVRYLMGVGYPTDIVEAVSRGIDLFDCVLPTRTARFGYAFTRQGRLAIKHARFTEDARPIDPACACYTCRSFSRAYLRHLHRSKEMLAPRLLTLHNLAFYQDLMRQIRAAIVAGPEALASLRQLARRWQEPYEDA